MEAFFDGSYFGKFCGYKTKWEMIEKFNRSLYDVVESVIPSAYCVGAILKSSMYSKIMVRDILGAVKFDDDEAGFSGGFSFTNAKKEKIHLATLKKIDISEHSQECPCCCNEACNGYLLECSSCSFTFCVNCLENHFKVQHAEAKRFLIPCLSASSCESYYHGLSLRTALKGIKSDPDAYTRLYKENLFTDFLLSDCVSQCDTCGTFMCWTTPPQKQDITCLYCHKQWCSGCNMMKHSPISCKMAMNWKAKVDFKFHKFFDRNIQRCPKPKCGAPIFKDGGCTHMTCARCETKFCWRCLQAVTQSQGWKHECIAVAEEDRKSFEIEHFSLEVKTEDLSRDIDIVYAKQFLYLYKMLYKIESLYRMTGKCFDDKTVLFQLLFCVTRFLMFACVFEFYECAKKNNQHIFAEYLKTYGASKRKVESVLAELVISEEKEKQLIEDEKQKSSTSSSTATRKKVQAGQIAEIIECFHEFKKSMVNMFPFLSLDYHVKLDNIVNLVRDMQIHVSNDFVESEATKKLLMSVGNDNREAGMIVQTIPVDMAKKKPSAEKKKAEKVDNSDNPLQRYHMEREEIDLAIAQSLSMMPQNNNVQLQEEMEIASVIAMQLSETTRFEEDLQKAKVQSICEMEPPGAERPKRDHGEVIERHRPAEPLLDEPSIEPANSGGGTKFFFKDELVSVRLTDEDIEVGDDFEVDYQDITQLSKRCHQHKKDGGISLVIETDDEQKVVLTTKNMGSKAFSEFIQDLTKRIEKLRDELSSDEESCRSDEEI